MKKLLKLALTNLILIWAITSCHKDAGVDNGKVEFSIPSSGLPGGRISGLKSILISVEDANGKSLFQRKALSLYSFGTEYLSDPVALTKGDFKLTEFIIVDENNAAIYATPLEGSVLAYLVSDPLPINFTVAKDQTTKVTPEVVAVNGGTGVDFGYATFGLTIINTFQFSTGIFTYNSQTTNFGLASSHVTITSGATTLFDKDLTAITNNVVVKDGYANYTVTVTKPGYLTYQKTFPASDLKAFVGAAPLQIVLLMQSISQGLIAHYPFSGNAHDTTANGHNGTLHNGVALTTDRKGFANSAYNFDGVDDYISVANTSDLNLTGDFSISLWTLPSSSQVLTGATQSTINDILRKWNGDAQGYPFSISYLNSTNATNPNQFLLVRSDSQPCINAPSLFSPIISADVFHHIVFIKQGNTLTQYLNNVLIGSTTDLTQGSACSVANTADMTIGVRGNLYRFYKGKIDDIRIYNRALTSSEVANLFAE